MKVGVTGHQDRDGIDWNWVSNQISHFLAGKNSLRGYSSLAVGTDQVFADCILLRKGILTAVIPAKGYRDLFKGNSLDKFDKLLARSEKVELSSDRLSEHSFLEAGKWIARKSDVMVAVWDGEPAEGKGGTGDIVKYSLSLGKSIYHIDPIKQEIHNINGDNI